MKHPLIPIAALASLAAFSVHAHGTMQHADGSQMQMQMQMQSNTQEQLAPPDIPVTDAAGRTEGFTTRMRNTGPVIVSFMYTNCETVCDITNGILYGVDQDLAGQDDRITLVSVAIDPANDTPEALRKTAAEFSASDRWLWLTAGMRGTSPLLDSLGVAFDSIETHDPMFLVGDFCSGAFTRIIGIPEPKALIAMARDVPECVSS
ncbi:SCO family protein [Paracoccus xiamenensis]|uniref:SCO family protein n=1 Tax=Paracoccus xiamenensis TaxID=2714901 RepID=UPI00140DA06C|nr:SCO family protein [Paracoccus xiamenensis]NHF72001.1 SCO family protein [Paracoccus xiamenensis]